MAWGEAAQGLGYIIGKTLKVSINVASICIVIFMLQ